MEAHSLFEEAGKMRILAEDDIYLSYLNFKIICTSHDVKTFSFTDLDGSFQMFPKGGFFHILRTFLQVMNSKTDMFSFKAALSSPLDR